MQRLGFGCLDRLHVLLKAGRHVHRDPPLLQVLAHGAHASQRHAAFVGFGHVGGHGGVSYISTALWLPVSSARSVRQMIGRRRLSPRFSVRLHLFTSPRRELLRLL
ncbi:MAG: hypothetical protein ACK55I_16630, partial [bacterium]